MLHSRLQVGIPVTSILREKQLIRYQLKDNEELLLDSKSDAGKPVAGSNPVPSALTSRKLQQEVVGIRTSP